MTTPKLTGVTPATTAGVVACSGVKSGDKISQVIDLTTGADVTASFDSRVRADDQIYQIDTTPSTAHVHLVLLNTKDAGIGVGTSIGNLTTTRGNVSVPGVKKNDRLIRLIWPAGPDTTDNSLDYTENLAPTSPDDDVFYQVWGMPTSHPFVVLYERHGAHSSLNIGGNAGMAPGNLGISAVQAGEKILSCVNMVTGNDETASFRPYAPDDGLLLQRPYTASNSDQILFLLQNQ